jgi:DNA-binding response OmpR family regulator
MKKQILIIDDESDILTLTAYRLKYEGYGVITASECDSGYKLAKEHKPDLILLDLHLPGMTGYELCHLIKKDNELHQIPVIFFSASSVGGDPLIKIEECKAQGYIQKPFEIETLFREIEKHLGSYDKNQETEALK